MAEIRLRVRVAPSAARWSLAAAILGAFAGELSTENAGLSTYYPAPSGVYSQIIAAQAAYLGRDAGTNVGIGTTSPQAALDVRGVFLAGGNPVAAGLAQPCPTGYDCKQTGNLLIIAKICGAPGQPCCPGSSCDNGLTCWGGTCESACGGGGQPCCPPVVAFMPPPSPGCTGGNLKCVGGSCSQWGCNGGTCQGPCSGSVSWTNQGCGAGSCASTDMYQVATCSPTGCYGCPSPRCAASDPSCAPTCNPSCQNGGTCTATNTCSCVGGYTGPGCGTPPAPPALPSYPNCASGGRECTCFMMHGCCGRLICSCSLLCCPTCCSLSGCYWTSGPQCPPNAPYNNSRPGWNCP